MAIWLAVITSTRHFSLKFFNLLLNILEPYFLCLRFSCSNLATHNSLLNPGTITKQSRASFVMVWSWSGLEFEFRQGMANNIYSILLCINKPQIKSPPKSYIAGLCQVWRHITVSKVLTQEEIYKHSTCRYVMLDALNVPHVPWQRFITP